MTGSPGPLITLTTDFGAGGTYVPQMKGVLLGLCPAARILDLSHELPPQDVRAAAWFVQETLVHYPAGTIHVVVVDPGVGTARAALLIAWRKQWLLCPDNGLWTWLPDADAASVRSLTRPEWWRPAPSNTFHGRDIFAPVAAHLANGTPAEAFGELVSDWVRLPFPQPHQIGTDWQAEVVAIDRFGNLLTNLRVAAGARPRCVLLEAQPATPIPWFATYGAAPPGSLIALASSSGWLEIAEVHGHAARRLGVGIGARLLARGDSEG